MKAIIEKGRIVIPKEILKEGYLPEDGEIELKFMEGWLKINYKKASRILKDLEKVPIRASIEEIVKAEVVEDA